MKKHLVVTQFFIAIVAIFMSLTLVQAQAKRGLQLNFKPTFNNNAIKMDDAVYYISNNDTIHITKLKFYISAIKFYYNNKLVFAEKNSYHLIDISDSNTLQLNISKVNNIKFNSLKFNLGIDSLTNTKGALGGDLDPTKGMYWTWHSGYINFKLEGTSNVCKTRNNAFEFHLGGFSAPYNSLQTIQLNLQNQSSVTVLVDVSKFLSQINLSKTNAIMTPSKEALELSKAAAKMFSIQQ